MHGGKSKAPITKDSIQFLNRLGEKFDWENDKVKTIQVVRSDPEKVQRDHAVPAEIPGIKIENNYEAVQGPAVKSEAEKEPMDARKLALAVRANAGLSIVDAPLDMTREVNECGTHDDAPVIDLTEDDFFLPAKSQHRVKH